MKRKILIGSLLVVILAIFALINLRDMAGLSVMRAEPKFYVKAAHLIHNFNVEEDPINSLQAEDIIGVEGVIKEINTLNNKQTIFLADSSRGNSSVLCDMQNNQKNRIQTLKLGDTIRVKGVFKGFLKDVILLNCVITNQNE